MRRLLPFGSSLSFLLLGLAGCQAIMSSFIVPATVRASTAFAMSVSGTGSGGGVGECACVLQLPNGFTVLAASFAGTEPVLAGPTRDNPAVLAGFQAEPGHYLVSYSGRTNFQIRGPGPSGTLTVGVMPPAIAASQVTFKVAMGSEVSTGVWQANDPPSVGVLDFATVGGNYARTVQFDLNRVVPFGTACAGTGFPAPQLQTTGGVPARGNGLFALTFSSGQPGGFGALWLGVDRATLGGFALPLDLLPFGAPGCRLYVNPLRQDIVQFDVLGGGGLSLPIPNDPALQDATFYTQGAQFLPGANAAGALFTGGLSIQVL